MYLDMGTGTVESGSSISQSSPGFQRQDLAQFAKLQIASPVYVIWAKVITQDNT